MNLQKHRPVLVVIGGSGRLADEIADSVFPPEKGMRQEIASLIQTGQVTVFNRHLQKTQFLHSNIRVLA